MPPQAKCPTFVRTKDLAAAVAYVPPPRVRQRKASRGPSLADRILAVLRRARRPLTYGEIAERLGGSAKAGGSVVTGVLALSDAGLVVVGNGERFAARRAAR